MSLLTGPLVAKRLEFIRQIVGANAPIAFLMNPRAPEAEFHLSHMQAAARKLGQESVTTGPRAPTDYLSSLALDSRAACGADRITTQRGRCARCFSQAATKQPTLFGQATLSRIDLGPQSYTARVGPFASEKDAAAACLALAAADIGCF